MPYILVLSRLVPWQPSCHQQAVSWFPGTGVPADRQTVGSASTLGHLLLDSGLLVEGMGCKASVRTVPSGRYGGLTM